jgi:hypothetical protein
MNPSKHKLSVLKQIFKLIPRNLIPKLAHKHGICVFDKAYVDFKHLYELLVRGVFQGNQTDFTAF